MICSMAWKPSIWGMMMSMVMISGLSVLVISTASSPFVAIPTITIDGSFLSRWARSSRERSESSTMRTFMGPIPLTLTLSPQGERGLYSLTVPPLMNQSPDCVQEIFLREFGLCNIGIGAGFKPPHPVLRRGQGRHDNDGDPLPSGIRRDLSGQLKSVHIRHLEVCLD